MQIVDIRYPAQMKSGYRTVIDQYYNTVRPMHEQFVELTKVHADVIIPEGGKNSVAIDLFTTKVESLLNQLKRG